MPRTGVQRSNLLSIELCNEKSSWLPGDSISGNVTRTASCEQPQLQVKITLFARCKTKIRRDNFTSSKIYRGRRILLGESQQVQLLQDGSQSSSYTAPFMFVIPSRTLPTLFYYKEKGVCTETEAYVEYALMAETVGNPNGIARASQPLFIRSPSTRQPVRDLKPAIKETRKVVKTLQLLAENKDRELTFGDRSQRLFRPFSMPRLDYTVHVEHPTVIQIDHPDTLRFKVHIVPNVDLSSSSICPDGDITNIPPVICNKILLSLECKTQIRTPATLVPQVSTWEHTYSLCHVKMRADTHVPVNAPLTGSPNSAQAPSAIINSKTLESSTSPEVLAKEESKWVPKWAAGRTQTASPKNGVDVLPLPDAASDSKRPSRPDPDSLDIASRLELRLLHFGVARSTAKPLHLFEKPLPPLAPSFSTGDIKVSYKLKWRITLQVADKEQVVNGSAPVTILAASEEQEKLREREIGAEGTGPNDDDAKCAAKNLMAAEGLILCSVM